MVCSALHDLHKEVYQNIYPPYECSILIEMPEWLKSEWLQEDYFNVKIKDFLEKLDLKILFD